MRARSWLNVMFMLLERDIHNYVNRPIRGAYGDSKPAYQSSSADGDENLLFEMTMATPSWQALNTATLTRTGWFFRDNQIIRQSWDVLDRAQDSEPREEVLLDGVKGVDLKYYVLKNKKYVIDKNWGSGAAPPGIVITVNMDDGPDFKRVFSFAGG